MKPSNATNDTLNDRTRRFWQPRLQRNLSDEDARQIAENVTGFFAILAEWTQAETPPPAKEAGKCVSPDNEESTNER